MKPLTAEWVSKAEGDFATMERESRVTDGPNFEGICFHAQQCAEKYLKARLCEAGIPFGKVHDLVALLELAQTIEPSWEASREDLAYLSGFAVSVRYPGDSADQDCAMDVTAEPCLSGGGASVIGIGCLKADSDQAVHKEGAERGVPLPNYPWKRRGGDTPVVEGGIVEVIRRYQAALPVVGIHARRAVLFGSFATGQAHQWSDTDLVVVAPEFDGPGDSPYAVGAGPLCLPASWEASACWM